MTPLEESINVLTSLMSGLASVVQGPSTGPQDSAFRRQYGDIIAEAATLLSTLTLPAPLLNAFNLATQTQATLLGYDLFRQKIVATPTVSALAVSVVNLFLWFTLGQEATIISTTQYASRQDADGDLATIDAAFQAAEISVADVDVGVYQQMITLHAAVIRDLVARSMLLPQVVDYSFPRTLPSLVLAQKLYPDDMLTVDRSDELILENKAINPAFMPSYGICLSE